jgi:hypothetical protein
VAARNLIACYRGTNLNFSLALALIGASREAKDTTQGGLKVEANIAGIITWFRWA